MWPRLIILLACLLIAPLEGRPAAAGPLDAAENAIRQGQTVQAIRDLEEFVPASPAETIRHLWALGVAYNKIGRAKTAITPLARLVNLVPDNPDYRLELAGALIRANQTERALYHLELVKGAGLAPDVQERVQAEIDRLGRPQFWQGYFRFAIVPESNAARRTSAETVQIRGMTFALNPTAREDSATGVDLGFGLAALPRLADGVNARFGLDVQARLFESTTIQDDVFLRGSAALLSFGDYSAYTSAEVFATRRFLDRQVYANSRGVSLTYSRAIGNRTRMSGTAEYEDVDYVQGKYSVQRKAATARLTFAASAQMMLRAGLRIEDRKSDYFHAGGVLQGVTVGADYLLSGGLRIGVDLAYDRNRFDGLHPLFGLERIDKKLSATLQVTNQNWSYLGFAPVLRLGAERQDSTIVLNSFRNMTASIGLTRSF